MLVNMFLIAPKLVEIPAYPEGEVHGFGHIRAIWTLQYLLLTSSPENKYTVCITLTLNIFQKLATTTKQ